MVIRMSSTARLRRIFLLALPLVLLGGGTGFVVNARSANLETASFIGRDSCADCHPREQQRWTGSDHDLAMEHASEETVLGDFSGVEFDFHKLHVVPKDLVIHIVHVGHCAVSSMSEPDSSSSSNHPLYVVCSPSGQTIDVRTGNAYRPKVLASR